MNDTTLPPSRKSNPRRRRGNGGAVRRGFGLHDWMNLLRRSTDLAQRRGAPIRRDISLEEVKSHDKPYDGWVVLRGKVYNIGPYLAYHPGGSEILERCLGKDATALFDKYHSWVNLDGLIGPLLLGSAKAERARAGDANDGGYLKVGVAGMPSIGEVGSGNDVVVPPAVASASSGNGKSCDDLGFAMPKPRPPKGEPMASLLPPGDNDDNSEDEDDTIRS